MKDNSLDVLNSLLIVPNIHRIVKLNEITPSKTLRIVATKRNPLITSYHTIPLAMNDSLVDLSIRQITVEMSLILNVETKGYRN